MAIDKEYRYRSIMHAGRLVRRNLVLPLLAKWEELKSAWGFGRSALDPLKEAELRRLEGCSLFDWAEVQMTIERARCGTFRNRNALNRLINALVVDEFLFDPPASGSVPLRFLESPRDIHFVSPLV
jgi:hypothetical protein